MQNNSRIKIIKRRRIEEIANPTINDSLVVDLSKSLARQIDAAEFSKTYAPARDVLKLVGIGVFLFASLAMPNLPKALRSVVKNNTDYEAWKRFNIPYLKRTLRRLEEQKLVEMSELKGMQVVMITEAGKRRILKFAIDALVIDKPKVWDKQWRLISYDIPGNMKTLRNVFREYITMWRFYPLHESVFLHAYPCKKQVEFLREYLGVGDFVRIFTVTRIENDQPFRQFFGI